MTRSDADPGAAVGEGSLFIQCSHDEVDAALALTRRPSAGVVVSRGGTAKVDSEVFSVALGRLAAAAGSRSCAADASLYAGSSRKFAAEGVTPEWVLHQRRLGLIPLSDSGYVGQDDVDGLRLILTESRRLGCVPVLPLATSWLRKASAARILTDEVASFGDTVAIALEHRNDPLGARDTVRGLLRLIGSGAPVWALRCDMSVLGAMSSGALAGAVGTRTGLRHIYPLPRPDKSGGGGGPPRVAAVVKELLSFRSLDSIALASLHEPDSSLWLCSCSVCDGRSLSWLAMIADPGVKSMRAFQHSYDVIYDLRDAIWSGDRSTAARQESWYAKCANAQLRDLEVDAVMPRWSSQPFLGAWRVAILEALPHLSLS